VPMRRSSSYANRGQGGNRIIPSRTRALPERESPFARQLLWSHLSVNNLPMT
jgi:hypothetical protein